MGNSREVVIVGGGAMGCAVAYHLAKEGVGATIVEREGVGSQASGYSAGGLNPLQGSGIPGPLAPLALDSFRMHVESWDQLRVESGLDFRPQMVSMVRAAFEESELPQLEETLDIFQAAKGFSADLVEPEYLYSLEPRLAQGILRGLHIEGNAAVDSLLYTVALSKAAEKLGAAVRLGAVIGFEKAGERVTSVLLEDGEISCDSVVVAAGPWSAQAGRWLGTPIPVEPLKGEILRMEAPGSAPLTHDFAWGSVSLHPRPGGQVWVSSTEEWCGFDRRPSKSARRGLLGEAVKLMPGIVEAVLVKHTACLRPVPPDWLPIIGRAPGWRNVYLATGGAKKGILISPGTGKAVADLITLGSTQVPIGHFAPERFAPAGA